MTYRNWICVGLVCTRTKFPIRYDNNRPSATWSLGSSALGWARKCRGLSLREWLSHSLAPGERPAKPWSVVRQVELLFIWLLGKVRSTLWNCCVEMFWMNLCSHQKTPEHKSEKSPDSTRVRAQINSGCQGMNTQTAPGTVILIWLCSKGKSGPDLSPKILHQHDHNCGAT